MYSQQDMDDSNTPYDIVLDDVFYDEKIEKKNIKNHIQNYMLKLSFLCTLLSSIGPVIHKDSKKYGTVFFTFFQEFIAFSNPKVIGFVSQNIISFILILPYIHLNILSMFRKSDIMLRLGSGYWSFICALYCILSIHFGQSFAYSIAGIVYKSSYVSDMLNILMLVMLFVVGICSYIKINLKLNENSVVFFIIIMLPFVLSFEKVLFMSLVGKVTSSTCLCFVTYILLSLTLLLIFKSNIFMQETNRKYIVCYAGTAFIATSKILETFAPQATAFLYFFYYAFSFSVFFFKFHDLGFVSELELKLKIADRISRSNSELNISEKRSMNEPVKRICGAPLQNIFMVIFYLTVLAVSLLLNALAAQRMPMTGRLPDLLQERLNIGNTLRSNTDAKTQFHNIYVSSLIIIISTSLIWANGCVNVRKFFFLHGLMFALRAIAFTVTNLPAPCSGLSNCPCADPDIIKFLNQKGILAISSAWLFGVGMFMKYPQCGDLIISGHTATITIVLLHLKEIITRRFSPRICNILTFVNLPPLLYTLVYIIAAHNHYTVDVFFGLTMTYLVHQLYTSIERHFDRGDNNTYDSFLYRFIYWYETRDFHINKKPYEETRPIESSSSP